MEFHRPLFHIAVHELQSFLFGENGLQSFINCDAGEDLALEKTAAQGREGFWFQYSRNPLKKQGMLA